MEVPDVAIQWMALHAQSDVDLARLSNVCHVWRRHVSEALANGHSNLLLPSMISYGRKKAKALHHNCSSESDAFCAAWFHPDGIQTVKVIAKPIEEDHLHKRLKAGFRDSCYEWRGYRKAVDILMPFGYSPQFVRSVLTNEGEGASDDNAHHEPTIAVRGTTFARPEGYCPCWDDDDEEHFNKYSQMIRQQQRTMLQRQMLPRTIQTWSPVSNGAEAIASSTLSPSSSSSSPSLPPSSPPSKQAIQFLSASGTNAVRLLTAPFACGPLVGKITIFCVGIATEDGCFMSGLKRRCEFGHMYPQSDRDNLIDMSSICIASNLDFEVGDHGFSEEDDDDDSEEESQELNESDRRRRASLHGTCSCPFNQNAELFDVDTATEHEEELKPPDVLHRGQRGPGQWHCYVAIIDGPDATIRIDGAMEPMIHLRRGGKSAGTPSGRVLLDGLTIGSDHSFDMSLCFGEGGPGEGEGAIAELAVFQGSMPSADIEALEQHLMAKYSIEPTIPGQQHLIQQEDEWKRDSRALIEQGVPYNIVVPEGVPLRIVAKDPSVSWHRTNPVTGQDIRVGRIGSRLSTGSSDW